MRTLLAKISNAPYYLLAAATVAVSSEASAQQSVGDVSQNLTDQMGNVGRLIVAGAFVGGLVMLATGLMKLKQAAETNGQVKYSEGMWRVGVGAGLVAIPAFSGMLGATFGWDQGTTITAGGGAAF